MSDLTDEELNGLVVTAGWMQRSSGASLTEADQQRVGQRIDRAIDELQRHRAAEPIRDAIAARAAKQLATAAARMPNRKEWERGDTPGESADYVDGWNDALDAADRLLATGAKP